MLLKSSTLSTSPSAAQRAHRPQTTVLRPFDEEQILIVAEDVRMDRHVALFPHRRAAQRIDHGQSLVSQHRHVGGLGRTDAPQRNAKWRPPAHLIHVQEFRVAVSIVLEFLQPDRAVVRDGFNGWQLPQFLAVVAVQTVDHPTDLANDQMPLHLIEAEAGVGEIRQVRVARQIHVVENVLMQRHRQRAELHFPACLVVHDVAQTDAGVVGVAVQEQSMLAGERQRIPSGCITKLVMIESLNAPAGSVWAAILTGPHEWLPSSRKGR